MMNTSAMNSRLDMINVSKIEFGSPNPVSHRGKFGNLDFLILTLAQQGPTRRRDLITAWSNWRRVYLGRVTRTCYVRVTGKLGSMTRNETLANNSFADIVMSSFLNTCDDRKTTNRFFEKGPGFATWQLTADGWTRANALVKILT